MEQGWTDRQTNGLAESRPRAYDRNVKPAANQPDLARALDGKLERMQAILRDLGRVVVAFSGGVDSTFVLKVALDTLGRERVLAITGRSSSLAQSELDDAIRLAEALGARHEIIDTDEFDDPNYLANPSDRCYFCKTTLYAHLERLIGERGLGPIVNGINADDYGDWRPGLKAAGEHGVRAPAGEAGLTKADVRALSARMDLPTHDKPASPCLSSRVQYGEAITPEKLRRIERAEAFLHGLGLRECRVRHHNNLARIEVPPGQIAALADEPLRSRIDAEFRSLGYAYVTVDLRGFRSGSMNEVINVRLPAAIEEGAGRQSETTLRGA